MALLFQLTQALSQGFTAFWSRYPNRTAKKDAEKAWSQVVTDDTTDAAIHAALDWQLPHWEAMDWYTPPYPATYLRQRRFEDEAPAALKPKLPAFVKAEISQFEDQRRRTQEAYRLIAEGMSREDAMTRAFRKES